MNRIYPWLWLVFIGRAHCDIAKGRCSVLLSNGTIDSFCCDDHQELNGSCVECDIGFSAVERESCLPCVYPTNGKKCGNICSCPEERCDHVVGCDASETTNFMPKDFTTEMTNLRLETLNTISESELESTVYQDREGIGRTRNFTEKTTENPGISMPDYIAGLLNREIAIYSICAGTFAVTLLLCTVWRHRYKRIYSYYKSQRLQSRRRQNIFTKTTPLPEIPVQKTEGIYETIDESNMIDEQILPNEFSSNLTNSRRQSSSLDDDDYLIPIHHESSAQNNLEHSKTFCESDSTESSVSSIEQNDTAYLNPYQPIVSTLDLNPYTKLLVSNSVVSLEQIQENTSLSNRECQQQILTLEEYECKSVITTNLILDGSQEIFLDYVQPSYSPQHSKLFNKPNQNVNSCGELELHDAGIGKLNGNEDKNDSFQSDNISHKLSDVNVSSQFQNDVFTGSEEIDDNRKNN